MNDYPYRFEVLLRGALNAPMRGQYYGIDADGGHDTEGIWKMAWATLTAVQFAQPEKATEIKAVLDDYYDLCSDNKRMSDWDVDRMQEFYDRIEKIIH